MNFIYFIPFPSFHSRHIRQASWMMAVGLWERCRVVIAGVFYSRPAAEATSVLRTGGLSARQKSGLAKREDAQRSGLQGQPETMSAGLVPGKF